MTDPEQSPFWSYEDLAFFIAAILPAVLLSSMLVRLLGAASNSLKILVFQSALLVQLLGVLYLLVSWRYEQPFWRALGWSFPVPRLGWILLGGPVLAIVLSALGVVLHEPAVDPIKDLITSRGSLLIVMFFAICLAPIYEELFFRGFLFPLLFRTFGAAGAVFLSALPFALLHGAQNHWAWQQITLVGVAGAVFGFVRLRTGSTAAATILHSGFNTTQFVAFLLLSNYRS